MAGKLSFAIAINLLTENFKRGTSQVQSALRSMQAQVLTFAAALGVGGIGLSNLVSRFIDVARETNRVSTALKNVSGTMGQYADNQRYLLELAKKYGLEINALTGNFAKFTAAASVSGMGMDEQRKIFESVSRACTAFGMSADDSNGVFLALSQMMSKGKINSEELRLQMGERLPIALQAMAKAAGTSVGGLDKLMKQGKLMSKDVLPKFAEALNEMIPNVDTDNLETSVNRLKNAFTELVNGTDIQNKYKALVDWMAEMIATAANNIKSIVTYAVAAIWVIISSKLVNKLLLAFAQTELAAKSAARKAAKNAGQAFDEVTWKLQKTSTTMKMMFTKAIASIRAAFFTMLPTAIITAIGAIVAKMVVMYQEGKRIKNLFADYRSELKSNTNTAEIVNLQNQYNIATDLKQNLDDRKVALTEINRQLGTNYGIDEKSLIIQGDLNKKFAERVELLKAAAEVDYLTRKKLDTEDEISRLTYKGISNIQSSMPSNTSTSPLDENFSLKAFWDGPTGVKTLWNVLSPWGGISDAKYESEELKEQKRILSSIDDKLKAATVKVNASLSGSTIIPTNEDDDKKKKKTELQKAEEKYKQELGELNAKLELEKLTRSEYNKALDDLNTKMYAEAKGKADKETLESQYFQNLKEAVKHPLYNKAQAELEAVQKKYTEDSKALEAQRANGLLTEKQYKEELQKLSVETAKAAGSISEVGLEGQAFIAAMNVTANLMSSPVKMKERDTTFDYKKSAVDIASEKLDIAKDYAKQLQEDARKMGKELEDSLAEAMEKVPSLKEALKLAQVKEDVKNFTKELNEGMYSGIKDIASSSDRVVSAFSQLRDVMNDVDASAWEQIMAIWNAMTQVVDSFMSICKTIETLTELSNKLSKAKQTEAAIDKVTTEEKVTNAVTGATASVAAASIEKSAAGTEVAANTAKGASAAGASAAKLPFPWNIVAIGGAIAAAIAAFAVIPKFANGGVITGGPSSGDRILARVNAGEMILNQGQQSRLFQAINSGQLGSGRNITVQVEGVVKGHDLHIVQRNYAKSTGKLNGRNINF